MKSDVCHCTCEYPCFTSKQLEAGLELKPIETACKKCIECLSLELSSKSLSNKYSVKRAISDWYRKHGVKN